MSTVPAWQRAHIFDQATLDSVRAVVCVTSMDDTSSRGLSLPIELLGYLADALFFEGLESVLCDQARMRHVLPFCMDF